MIAHGSNQCARCVGRRRGRDEGNLFGDGRLWIGGLGVERANERRGNDVVFELTEIAEFVQLRGTLTTRIELIGEEGTRGQRAGTTHSVCL